MRDIHKLIVHCSDTPNDRHVTVDEIRRWHVEGNGWSDIGYHYVIYRNGNLMTGRNTSRNGAHCSGHNHDSIGVCLVGRDVFTEEHFATLKNLQATLKGFFPTIKPYGHRDFSSHKTCPNFDVKEVLG